MPLNLIRETLRKKRMSQGELSRKSGVDRVHLCRIVGGHIVNPSVETAVKIARALEVSVESLWPGE